MKLATLSGVLDEKFEVSRIKEDWSFAFDNLVPNQRMTDSFKRSSVGLFMAPGEEVSKIYTACFPGRFVLSEIEKRGTKDVLLVTKHPFDWDGKKGFLPFQDDEIELIQRLRINIYSLHTPLDKCRNESGLFSTAYAFAKAIGLKPEGEFASEGKANPMMHTGVYGRVIDQDISILSRSISARIRHDVKVFNHSPNPVRKVGIVTGGGSQRELVVEAKGLGIDTYITGVTQPNSWPPSVEQTAEFFATAKKFNINVIGASHYLTEKFVLELSMPYFSRLGVPAEFIEDLEAWNRLD